MACLCTNAAQGARPNACFNKQPVCLSKSRACISHVDMIPEELQDLLPHQPMCKHMQGAHGRHRSITTLQGHSIHQNEQAAPAQARRRGAHMHPTEAHPCGSRALLPPAPAGLPHRETLFQKPALLYHAACISTKQAGAKRALQLCAGLITLPLHTPDVSMLQHSTLICHHAVTL